METIIAPTDFSPAANNAVDYAVQLGAFLNAQVVLVNAYPLPYVNYEMSYTADVLDVFKKSSVEKLQNLKKEIIQKYKLDLYIECVSEMGSPYDVVSIVAEKYDADLIVMGITDDAGLIKEHIIGSTAVRISRDLQTPTFIVPEDAKYRPVKKISFACDLEKTEETDLVYVAKYFAQTFGAKLEVIYVKGPREMELSVEKAKTISFVEEKLENVNHRTIEITGSDVGNELEDYFRFHQTDLVMLSPKKHSLFHYILHNSVTKDLAFHIGLPILAIH